VVLGIERHLLVRHDRAWHCLDSVRLSNLRHLLLL
jgi:hypothetical protein